MIAIKCLRLTLVKPPRRSTSSLDDHHMAQPLSKSQESLRGKKIVDMSVSELKDWVAACDAMEVWKHTPSKARRGWKRSRSEAIAELAHRGEGIERV